MAYGKIKADAIIYDNSGSDVEKTIASLASAAPSASPTFTGTVTVPTASANDNTTKAASTAYVQTELGDYITTSTVTSTYAPLASPTLTGTPAAPTASANTNTTQIATTAFVMTEVGDYAPLSGATFTGDVTLTGQSANIVFDKSDNALKFADNAKANFGTSDDLQIYHSGTESFIADEGTGGITISGGVLSFKNQARDETLATMTVNAGVELFYDNTKRAETTNTGFNVVGAITVNGAALASGVTSDSNQNTEGGTEALNSNTSSYNVAFGYRALYSNTSGSYNVAFGRRALNSCTSGVQNCALGSDALYSMVGANNNTAVGTSALHGITSGAGNVGVGYIAGYEAHTTTECIFIGFSAGRRQASGSNNIGIGSYALTGAQTSSGDGTGSNNTCVGNKCGRHMTSASNNVFMGSGSGQGCTTGSTNVAIGFEAMRDATAPSQCICIGQQCATDLTTADKNVILGYAAALGMTSGSNNICLGYGAGWSISPSGTITTGSNNVVLGDNNIQNLYCADTSISSSDKRDKTDVANFTHGLSWINKLNPVTYRWDKRTWYNEYDEKGKLKTEITPNGSKKRAKQHIGFLAQDVLAVEQADGFASKKDDMLVVNLNEDDTGYGLKYERLVPVLVNAIKELSAKVEALEAK